MPQENGKVKGNGNELIFNGSKFFRTYLILTFLVQPHLLSSKTA